MTKKIIGCIIALSLICCTSFVLATNNELGDSVNKASNTVRNVVGGTENVVENVAGNIGTGVRDLGNTFAEGASRVTNDNNNDGMNNDGYTATRTSTDNGTILGMNANTWTWFILAIVAIAIVGLVWYYAMQNSNEYNDNDNH